MFVTDWNPEPILSSDINNWDMKQIFTAEADMG